MIACDFCKVVLVFYMNKKFLSECRSYTEGHQDSSDLLEDVLYARDGNLPLKETMTLVLVSGWNVFGHKGLKCGYPFRAGDCMGHMF